MINTLYIKYICVENTKHEYIDTQGMFSNNIYFLVIHSSTFHLFIYLLFIYSFIYFLFIHWSTFCSFFHILFVHSFIYFLFIRLLFIHSSTFHSFIYFLFIHSVTLYTLLQTKSVIYSTIYSFECAAIDAIDAIQPFIHSYMHSFTYDNIKHLHIYSLRLIYFD